MFTAHRGESHIRCETGISPDGESVPSTSSTAVQYSNDADPLVETMRKGTLILTLQEATVWKERCGVGVGGCPFCFPPSSPYFLPCRAFGFLAFLKAPAGGRRIVMEAEVFSALLLPGGLTVAIFLSMFSPDILSGLMMLMAPSVPRGQFNQHTLVLCFLCLGLTLFSFLLCLRVHMCEPCGRHWEI